MNLLGTYDNTPEGERGALDFVVRCGWLARDVAALADGAVGAEIVAKLNDAKDAMQAAETALREAFDLSFPS